MPRTIISITKLAAAPSAQATFGVIAGGLIVAGTGAIEANQQKKALEGQQGILNSLTYTPIDISQIEKDAATQAATNAAAALNLEKSLTPDVAATRANLSKSVSDQLKLGGQVSPDIANQVAQAARVAGGVSGGFGGTPGVTAATLGTTAMNLLNQRQAAASQLLAANPLPTAGLDPGSVASAEIANNNAENQFALEKAGANSNLLNSQAQVTSGIVGQTGSGLSSLASLYALLNKPTTTTTTPTATTPNPAASSLYTSVPATASYNAALIPGG